MGKVQTTFLLLMVAIGGCQQPGQAEPAIPFEELVKITPELMWNQPNPVDGGGLEAVEKANAAFTSGLEGSRPIRYIRSTASSGEETSKYWSPTIRKVVRERGEQLIADSNSAMTMDFDLYKRPPFEGLNILKDLKVNLEAVAMERAERGDVEGAYRATDAIWKLAYKLNMMIEEGFDLSVVVNIHQSWFSTMSTLISRGWHSSDAEEVLLNWEVPLDGLQKANILYAREYLKLAAGAEVNEAHLRAMTNPGAAYDEMLLTSLRAKIHPIDRRETAKMIGQVYKGEIDGTTSIEGLIRNYDSATGKYSRGMEDWVKTTENPLGKILVAHYSGMKFAIEDNFKSIEVDHKGICLALECLKYERTHSRLPSNTKLLGYDEKLFRLVPESRRIIIGTSRSGWLPSGEMAKTIRLP